MIVVGWLVTGDEGRVVEHRTLAFMDADRAQRAAVLLVQLAAVRA